MMGLNLNPILRQELANLDKDADSRKSAMKALKSYVKDLDSKAIPIFLAQVSKTKETSSLSSEYTISLYEILARVHGPNIVPQIDTIISTIIKTLASSAGSFPLQQACSKVVPAIARYGIDPMTPEDRKRKIIHSLCKPFSDSLLGSQESVISGSALCLKALVDCDNWRFASDDIVNHVCQNVAVALDSNSNQTHLHMGLVMALAKRNPLIVEAYARLLIRSGLKILNSGVLEGNSQKRLSAVQMLNFLMKCLDPRSVYSEVELIINEMEKCQSDQMAYVRGAAYEAMMTAKRIAGEKESKFEKGRSHSVTGSNFGTRNHNRARNLTNHNANSPISISPESQTLDSFTGYDSPFSITQDSFDSEYDRRSVNRKLWSCRKGGVDVSLKDGLFSGVTQESCVSDSPLVPYELSGSGTEGSEEFEGFLLENPRNGFVRSANPSPQRQRSHMSLDNINIFSTPRRLIRSLQDPNGTNSAFSDKQTRMFTSPCSRNNSSTRKQNGFLEDSAKKIQENGNLFGKNCRKSRSVSESVSSTDDAPFDTNTQIHLDMVMENRSRIQTMQLEKTGKRAGFRFVLGLFLVAVAVLASVIWIDVQDDVHHYPVPT